MAPLLRMVSEFVFVTANISSLCANIYVNSLFKQSAWLVCRGNHECRDWGITVSRREQSEGLRAVAAFWHSTPIREMDFVKHAHMSGVKQTDRKRKGCGCLLLMLLRSLILMLKDKFGFLGERQMRRSTALPRPSAHCGAGASSRVV